MQESSEGMEVAISIPGLNFERVLGEKKFLYTDIPISQFKNFRKSKDLFSQNEIKILSEISGIKKIED